MAKTLSTMAPLGMSISNGLLLDPTKDQTKKLSDFIQANKPTLIAFISNHCPFVKHIKKAFIELSHRYMDKVTFIAINSNDVINYPEDHPNKMPQENYPFSYLFDESQELAKAFMAACTPDFFLFDKEGKLIYRGQFDESRPSNDITPSGKDLELAIEAALNGKLPNEKQTPSIGCNIKWKE